MLKDIFTSRLILLGLLFFQVFYFWFGFLKPSFLLDLITFKEPHNDRTILFYAYFEKNKIYSFRLKFFLDVAVRETDPIDYVFIIQGGNVNVAFPNYTNIRIIKRDNDCYDFGAYGDAINRIGGIEQIKKYKAVMFINPSGTGPILPKYWPKSIHWSYAFTSKLRNNIHAVSISICCAPNDFREYAPGLESYAFAATPYAVEVALNAGVYSCKKDMDDAIVTGEYLFSKVLIRNKLNLESFLLKYPENTDYTNSLNWHCNDNQHPTMNKTYNFDEKDKICVYPLETMFHKVFWTRSNHFVYYDETLVYMGLALNRTDKN